MIVCPPPTPVNQVRHDFEAEKVGVFTRDFRHDEMTSSVLITGKDREIYCIMLWALKQRPQPLDALVHHTMSVPVWCMLKHPP